MIATASIEISEKIDELTQLITESDTSKLDKKSPSLMPSDYDLIFHFMKSLLEKNQLLLSKMPESQVDENPIYSFYDLEPSKISISCIYTLNSKFDMKILKNKGQDKNNEEGVLSEKKSQNNADSASTTDTKPIFIESRNIYLVNAKVGEAYSDSLCIEGLKSIRLIDCGGTGLEFDTDSQLVSGTPMEPGDFVIKFQGLLGGQRLDILAKLAVIPDPRSLWKNIPSSIEGKFSKPDEASAMLTEELFCVAASKRGRSHAQNGDYRDDDFGLSLCDKSGWYISIVADGAGSAKYSRHGSKVAVSSVLESLPVLLDEYLNQGALDFIESCNGVFDSSSVNKIQNYLYQSLVTAAFKAAKLIEEVAKSEDASASDFSTTLIVVVAKKLSNNWFVGSFSIGDGGAAVIQINDSKITPLTKADSGEYAGQTRFLSKQEFSDSSELLDRVSFGTFSNFTAIVLMTDGISDPKFPTDVSFEDYSLWLDFWNKDLGSAIDFTADVAKIETDLLQWMDFWSPGDHDDRTLALMVPRVDLV